MSGRSGWRGDSAGAEARVMRGRAAIEELPPDRAGGQVQSEERR
jgi:hypothetical protein